MHEKDEKLKLEKMIWITLESYEILRKQKKEQKISMAKIVCNLILQEYGDESVSKMPRE